MAATNPCRTCFDNKGLCGRGNRMKNFFVLTLQEDFQDRTVIPCYTRAYFLQKYALARCQTKTFTVSLVSKEEFSFSVNVTNQTGITYISGRIWKEFARIYALEAGHELYFSIGTHGTKTGVTTQNLPITHPFYYNLSRKDRETVDSLSATDGTKINWKMMETVIQYVHNLEHLMELHGAGDYVEGTIAAMMHTLKRTNYGTHSKHLKILRRYVPVDMPRDGNITIMSNAYSRVKGSYTTSAEDGRLCISTTWKEFLMKEPLLKVGDKMLFLLFVGEKGPDLFVGYVPDVVPE